MACLLDTNVLLRLFDRQSEVHLAVQAAVDRLRSQGETLLFAPQNAAEFWNVATRPREKNGLGLTAGQASRLLDELERLFTLLPEVPAMYPAWRLLVQTAQVVGVHVHDARLVAWMQTHRLSTILTLNPNDFYRFRSMTGIVVLHPLDLVSDTGEWK
jgi:predicted nucleic acid-binding protein